MSEKLQILVEPGNPFGFNSDEFADLVGEVRDELGAEYDLRVAYRDQVGAAVTLYEVVEFWLSWQSWSAAAQAVLLERLLSKAVGWKERRSEQNPGAPFRPFLASVIVAVDKTKAMVVGEVKIEAPGDEPEYRLFPNEEDSTRSFQKAPPPIRSWPPSEEKLPQRPAEELALRRLMLESLHAMIREAQRRGRETVILDSATVAGIGTSMRLNAVESQGLFKRLVEGNYLRVRGALSDRRYSGELHVEVEYLSDQGLREIGEI
jgi:hypothetical protein